MNDDRDVDARFREIIGAEFGAPPAPRPAPRTRAFDDFNLAEALDEADGTPDDFERYVPAPLPSSRPRARVVLAGLLMLIGVGVTLLGLFGAGFGRPVVWGGIIATLVGLAVLLGSTPRTRRDPWDDGARL